MLKRQFADDFILGACISHSSVAARTSEHSVRTYVAPALMETWTRSHYAVLSFASLSTCGTNYVQDMLTVLQPVITGRTSCEEKPANHSDCCHDCLGFDDRDYNLIHMELFLTCAVSLLISGYLLDKFGNWILIVLVSFTLAGTCIISTAACLKGTAAVKPLMYIGAFLRGAGFLTSLVARSRLLASWFLGKEIGFAFGMATAINRVGSIPSYMLTEVIREAVGLPATLWLGALISMLSVLCAIAAVLIDSTSASTRVRELDTEGRKAMSLKDVTRFSAQYWILITIIGFYSGVLRSIQANATEMIHEKFGLKKTLAAVVAGEIMYISVIFAPLIGLLLDKTGRKGYGILFGSLVHIPALSLLAFTGITPVVGCFLMGLGFSCYTAVLVPVVPLLVDRSCVGMGIALAQLSTTVCTAAVLAVLAEILGHFSGVTLREKQQRWQLSLSFILMVAVIAAALAVALVALSLKHNSILTRKQEGWKAVRTSDNDEEQGRQ